MEQEMTMKTQHNPIYHRPEITGIPYLTEKQADNRPDS